MAGSPVQSIHAARSEERMADEGRIKTEIVDGVGLLTVCGRTARNTVTEGMWTALAGALEKLDKDDAVSLLVLTGGGHEAFGTDPVEDDPEYQEHREAAGPDGADAGKQACAALARFAKPVLARIRGECIGAGLALALAADIRIAAEDSGFAMTARRAAELDVERALVAAVGPSHARFLLLTGERVEAREALRLGLVNRVFPDAELSDQVADLVRQINDQDAAALRRAKLTVAKFSYPEHAGHAEHAGDTDTQGG
jgi:enoyl-CoA hydratase/carnithine racemase